MLADPAQPDLLHRRLRDGPLPVPHAPTTSGWSNSCRVGYLPPTGSLGPFTAHVGKTGTLSVRCREACGCTSGDVYQSLVPIIGYRGFESLPHRIISLEQSNFPRYKHRMIQGHNIPEDMLKTHKNRPKTFSLCSSFLARLSRRGGERSMELRLNRIGRRASSGYQIRQFGQK